MTSEVHLIDCVEFMRGLPDKCFDLAIVDPPYGINIEKSGTHFKKFKTKGWDNEVPTSEYFEQLFRISNNQIIWGGNYFLEFLCSSKCFLIWDKLIGEGMSFADAELAWTSFKNPTRIFKESPSQINRIHPTQKPVALYRWLLRNYAKPNDTIFDSHMGSQSSRIACHMEGFDFTGCELDPEYFQQGNERYNTFLKTYGTPDPEKAIKGQQINLF